MTLRSKIPPRAAAVSLLLLTLILRVLLRILHDVSWLIASAWLVNDCVFTVSFFLDNLLEGAAVLSSIPFTWCPFPALRLGYDFTYLYS